MPLVCPRCSRTLEFSGDRPSFCAYCGQPLASLTSPQLETVAIPASGGVATAANDFNDATVAFIRSGSSREAAAPERIAGFRLIRPLGRGGMGTVYEAEDSQFGRRVALKLIAPGQLESRDAVERFRQEGRLASTIAHPRCVFVLAADEEAGRPYIVMELMPGSTLQTLVEEKGPLLPDEAVAKILDVIEGLEEAHQLGVVHRDVKPSNCFLEADGRVKVGDFGLSKSMSGDAHLTRTGAFIGTPLYSSPEQIRGETVDGRTDVYSVAATLYFLLSGKPPHQASDAAGTLAKIVADPVPPLRSLRPEIPAGLDRAVLKGLERQRERRWQSLDHLRRGLLPYAPARRSITGVWLRAAAFMIDASVFKFLPVALLQLVIILIHGTSETRISWSVWVSLVLDVVLWGIVFGAIEGTFGHTPGKWMLRLQVRRAQGVGETGWRQTFLRTGLLYLILGLPAQLLAIAELITGRQWLLLPIFAVRGLGALVVVSTMRARNGFRGPHDLISNTCVVRLAEPPKRRAPRIRREIRPFRNPMKRPIGVVEMVGPFRIGGAVRWESDRRVLLGEDPGLKRQVWIVMRPKGSPAPLPSRRDLGRPTRARWLTGGDDSNGRWDAFTAPTGCSLVDLAGIEGLPWCDVRPILSDLANELAAGCSDGSLPATLSLEQVWVEPDGRVLLIDALAPEGEKRDEDCALRALRLLRQAAAVALEGGLRRVDDDATPVRAVAPRHAIEFIDRLRNGQDEFHDPGAAATALGLMSDQPTEVGRISRLVRMGFMAALCGVGIAAMFIFPLSQSMAIASFEMNHPGEPLDGLRLGFAILATWAVVLPPALWLIWSFATRGGICLHWLGMALTTWNGRLAGRWRCAWRTLVTWGPPAALLATGVWYQANNPTKVWPFWAIWTVAVVWLVADATIAIKTPSRSLHDRLSGTYLVPK
jgi:eukaryotic-like serine/threonine-protein kinase